MWPLRGLVPCSGGFLHCAVLQACSLQWPWGLLAVAPYDPEVSLQRTKRVLRMTYGYSPYHLGGSNFLLNRGTYVWFLKPEGKRNSRIFERIRSFAQGKKFPNKSQEICA